MLNRSSLKTSLIAQMALLTLIAFGLLACTKANNNPVANSGENTQQPVDSLVNASRQPWRYLSSFDANVTVDRSFTHSSTTGYVLVSWQETRTNHLSSHDVISITAKATVYDPNRGAWSPIVEVRKIEKDPNQVVPVFLLNIEKQSIDNQGNAVIAVSTTIVDDVTSGQSGYTERFYRFHSDNNTWPEIINPLSVETVPGALFDKSAGSPFMPDHTDNGVLYYTFSPRSREANDFRVYHLANDGTWQTISAPDFQVIANRFTPPLCATCLKLMLQKWTSDSSGRLWIIFMASQNGFNIGTFVVRYDPIAQWDTPTILHTFGTEIKVGYVPYSERLSINSQTDEAMVAWTQPLGVTGNQMLQRVVFTEYAPGTGWGEMQVAIPSTVRDVVKRNNGDVTIIAEDFSSWTTSSTSSIAFPQSWKDKTGVLTGDRFYAIKTPHNDDPSSPIEIVNLSNDGWSYSTTLPSSLNANTDNWVISNGSLIGIVLSQGTLGWASWKLP